MFLLVKLHTDMGLEAVLPGPQNALYVMLCYVTRRQLNLRRRETWNCVHSPLSTRRSLLPS